MHKIGSNKIGKFTSISENPPRDLTKPEFIKLQTQHNNAAAWCLHSIRKPTNPNATHKYKYSHHAFHKYKVKGFTNCLTKLAPHQRSAFATPGNQQLTNHIQLHTGTWQIMTIWLQYLWAWEALTTFPSNVVTFLHFQIAQRVAAITRITEEKGSASVCISAPK